MREKSKVKMFFKGEGMRL